jgi:hypothetical protein
VKLQSFVWPVLLVTLGCADIVSGAASNLPTPSASSREWEPPRRTFESALTPNDDRRQGAGRSARSFARGRVHLKVWEDRTFEYHLSIHNPAREAFAMAHVHRVAGGESGPVVLTLFSGASLRDRHIEVRGTASVADGDAEALLDALRANPDSFYVSIHSTSDPDGAIRGPIR